MTEAEYMLRNGQQKTGSVPTVSLNGEERVPSPLPTEHLPKVPGHRSSEAAPPPSPNVAPNGNNQHPKHTTAVQSTKSKACRKKKKCLSDIFGHIIGGSKESSTVSDTLDQLHSLKEEPEDSPYADLDSVPMLHRPKRIAVSPAQDKDRWVRKEREFAQKVSRSTDLRDSMIELSSNFTTSEGSCQELLSPTQKHSLNLPASSRLMTSALEAEEDSDLKDVTSPTSPNTPSECSTTPINAAPSWESSADTSLNSANLCSPKRRARKPDKKHIRNGSLMKSRSEGLSESSVEAAKIKTENAVPNPSLSSSPSSSLSPMDAFKDGRELTFKSLVKEETSDSEVNVFRPDSNYKFSTYLMLLKDMHDTREKEGKPLALPPSPVLIKEEPQFIPMPALKDSVDLFMQQFKTEAGESDRPRPPQHRGLKTKNRTKPIMSADTYHCQDFPVRTPIGGSDKQRRKQKLPAKIKLSIAGLSSELADLAFGREFVSGHGDLADRGPGHLPPASYLARNSETTVAPKKRWQMVEGGVAEGMSGLSAEMNGSYARRTSSEHDLNVEKQPENDSHFFEAFGAAG